MLAKADPESTPAPVADPTAIPPLCGEEEFAALVDNMVADIAPRLFAVVQEYGDRVDATCAAWGMAFDDHAEVVGVEGVRASLRSAENALRYFRCGSHITPRLVWVNPAAATEPEADDALWRS